MSEQTVDADMAETLREIASAVEIEAASFKAHIDVLRRIVGACPWETEGKTGTREFWAAMRLAQKMVIPPRLTDCQWDAERMAGR